ncbi:carbohydrate kinase family protein [Enemella evansiae]|uniref:carbohydrate kinase family protein n=1 Tax=Enemella evansiae TaxID=2016499 RepID=UPI0010620D13|nr:PfkB family carbohydrate kinase [Enemella evansiae]TDO89880.1 sugar/nucleoside kinase (ribokinase family) [Enemella evansiae]
MRTLVAGHLCLDLFVQSETAPGQEPGRLYDVGALRPRLGGAVATTGSALSELGVPVSVAATVGEDELAQVLSGLLDRAGIDLARITTVPGPTSYSIVIQPPGLDRTFWHCSGANESFTGADLDLSGIDVLHVGYPSLLPGLLADEGRALTTLLTRAREQGVITSLDLAVVDERRAQETSYAALLGRWLPLVDVLSPSLDDLNSALGWELRPDPDGLVTAARRLVELGTQIAAVTGGNQGIAVDTQSSLDSIPLPALHPGATFVPSAPARRVVTTTGAGDVATAGLLSGLIHGAGITGAARQAVDVAARHVAGDPLTAAEPIRQGDQ